jgi:hypothetical protein
MVLIAAIDRSREQQRPCLVILLLGVLGQLAKEFRWLWGYRRNVRRRSLR